jgi:hypothetical protein
MMKNLIFLLGMLALVSTTIAQPPPGNEIYVFDLSLKKEKIQLTNLQNITNHLGYDNQPYFHPDKTLIYYTSANADGKTDLKEYDYKTKNTRNITNSTDGEFSPTVTPDGKFISCIMQRENGAQDLGKYPIEGGAPIILINTLTVGYHAWINETNLLLFILGDTMSLHQYNLSSGSDKIIAKQIGRSLHKIPNSESMSFVHKVSEKEWLIKRLNADGSIETITSTLPGREDLTWTPDRKILMSDGKSLFYYSLDKKEWQKIEMTPFSTGTITRLAINKKGNKLAMVVSE